MASNSSVFSFSGDDLIPVLSNTNAKYKILVIEDDLDLAQDVLTTLARSGMECRHTTDSEIGLEALSTDDFHLALLDLNLSQQNGPETCRQARKISTVPLIVLMTQNEDAQLKSFSLGADDYLIKPFSPQILLLRVLSMLRRSYVYNRKKHKFKVPFPALPLSTGPSSAPPSDSAVSTILSPDSPPPAATPEDDGKAKVPSGWSHCDICDYMGPTPKFQTQDANGRPVMACPNCGDQSSIHYTLA